MAKIANANMAYIADYWDRGSIKEFGWVLRYFAARIGRDIEGFEFTRKFYAEISDIADDLVVEALIAKKALIKKNDRKKEGVDMSIDPQNIYMDLADLAITETKSMSKYQGIEPSRIAPSVVDDFVEIIIDIKHYGSRDWEMDELDKARREWEEKEADTDPEEIDEKEKRSILDCLSSCISKAIERWNI